ncbi:DhNV_091 [Dikerogammarus haemobaphes nudivirus]|nr:DhNV_091 [Dikerogammarus haemobaphes nudivirus]
MAATKFMALTDTLLLNYNASWIQGYFTDCGATNIDEIREMILNEVMYCNKLLVKNNCLEFEFTFIKSQSTAQFRDIEQYRFLIMNRDGNSIKLLNALKTKLHSIFKSARGLDRHSPDVYPGFFYAAANKYYKRDPITYDYISFLKLYKTNNSFIISNNQNAVDYFNALVVA